MSTYSRSFIVAVLIVITTSIAAAGTRRISARFAATPLAAALAEVAGQAGAHAEWQGEPDRAPISITLTGVTFDEALRRLLQRHSYYVIGEEGGETARRVIVLAGHARAAATVSVVSASGTNTAAATQRSPGTGESESPATALDDPDPAVRRRLLELVRSFDPHDPRRMMVLARLRDDPDPGLRAAARDLVEARTTAAHDPHEPAPF